MARVQSEFLSFVVMMKRSEKSEKDARQSEPTGTQSWLLVVQRE